MEERFLKREQEMKELLLPLFEDLSTLSFTGAVERLKVIFSETKSPLTDNVSEVTQFCITLEGVLRHQQKGELPWQHDSSA